MKSLRWMAVFCFVSAMVLRMLSRFVSFGFAVVVAPGVHRDVWPQGIVFWGLLVLSVLLMAMSLLRQAR